MNRTQQTDRVSTTEQRPQVVVEAEVTTEVSRGSDGDLSDGVAAVIETAHVDVEQVEITAVTPGINGITTTATVRVAISPAAFTGTDDDDPMGGSGAASVGSDAAEAVLTTAVESAVGTSIDNTQRVGGAV